MNLKIGKGVSFEEVAGLINLSRVNQIELEPLIQKARWRIYGAKEKGRRTVRYSIVFLDYNARTTDLSEASANIPTESYEVVFHPSLQLLRESILSALPKATDIFDIKGFLSSFIRDELDQYLKNLHEEEKPKNFIEPSIEIREGAVGVSSGSNPLVPFLHGSLVPSHFGGIAFVLAEPGQGKTYLAQHIASLLAERARRDSSRPIPFLIRSEQWKDLSPSKTGDLAQVVLRCLSYYRGSIPWLEGNEEHFLHVVLKAGIFQMIFDGFDEYILSSDGSRVPADIINSIQSLCIETGARVVITSRTSFWKATFAGDESLAVNYNPKTPLLFTEILPFNKDQALEYFRARFADLSDREESIQAAFGQFRRLASPAGSLAGRGFVLHLIADSVARYGPNSGVDRTKSERGLRGLIKDMCRREQTRQELPFDDSLQYEILKDFAVETAQGSSDSTDTLVVCMAGKQHFEERQREKYVNKMQSHPILARSGENWRFCDGQIRIYLIADRMCELIEMDEAFTKMVGMFRISEADRQLIAEMFVRLLKDVRLVDCEQLIGKAVRMASSADAPLLGGQIALNGVNVLLREGAEHKRRSKLLQQFSEGYGIGGMSFSGSLPAFNFAGMEFVDCNFQEATFINCEFDAETQFVRCRFLGGKAPEFSKGFGLAKFIDTTDDETASAWIQTEMVAAGSKNYQKGNLKRDIDSILDKLVAKGGIGLKAVTKANLSRGIISRSKYKDKILEKIIKELLVGHNVTGMKESAYKPSDSVKDDFQFYSSNNTYAGSVLRVFDGLAHDLGLN